MGRIFRIVDEAEEYQRGYNQRESDDRMLEKAFKEGKWQVWANYSVKGITGKISEQDPVALEAFVRANNILPMIGAREKELIK